MDPQELLASTLLLSSAALETYKRICTKNKLAIDNVLNRMKIHCNLILQSVKTSKDSFKILTQFFDAIQDLEHYLFTMGNNKIDIQHSSDLLDTCYQRLQDLSGNIEATAEGNDVFEFSPSRFYPIILMNGDLNIIKALLIRNGQGYSQGACSQPVIPRLLGDIEQEDIEAHELSICIKQRQQSLINRSQMAISPSTFTQPTRDTKFSICLRDHHFDIFTRDMDSVPKSNMAQIFAVNEQLCDLLKGLQHQVKEVQEGLVHLEPDVCYRLDILLTALNVEMNNFLDLQALLPVLSQQTEYNGDKMPGFEGSPTTGGSDINAGANQFSSAEFIPSSNDDKFQDSDECQSDDDFEALLDSIETAAEPVTYSQPSEEMLKVLKECCVKEYVTDVGWSISSSSENVIMVHGKGVTDVIKLRLENELSGRFPKVSFIFADSEATSNHLSCIIFQKTCNKEKPDVEWFENAKATCELVLKGTQPHKGNRESLFAVTSAHLLLREEEMKKLEKHDEQFHLKLQECRDNVQKRIDKFFYSAALHPQSPFRIHLCHPPLISYRNLKHKHDGKSYDYMSDIALIPVEGDNGDSIRRWVASTEICQLSCIRRLDQKQVFLLTNKNPPPIVYANGRRGTIVRLEGTLDENDAVPARGLHIPFTLDEE